MVNMIRSRNARPRFFKGMVCVQLLLLSLPPDQGRRLSQDEQPARSSCSALMRDATVQAYFAGLNPRQLPKERGQQKVSKSDFKGTVP